MLPRFRSQIVLAVALALPLTVGHFAAADGPAATEIVSDAKLVKPLDVGATVPDVSVRTSGGEETQLSQVLDGRPTALVFYRGGWCPICSRHTNQLIDVYPTLKQAGVQIVAISPDTPDNAVATQSKLDVPYSVLSDSDLSAAKAFGLAFQVDDGTLERYRGFGIDLEAASGRDHHSLPVPAVYLIDADGKIVFRHYDPDYRKRLSGEKVVEAVKEHLADKS